MKTATLQKTGLSLAGIIIAAVLFVSPGVRIPGLDSAADTYFNNAITKAQTGIVIPENHMLMQAMLFEKSYEESFAHTESIFHMNEKKQKLQEYFAKK